jgi:hypothetical protein
VFRVRWTAFTPVQKHVDGFTTDTFGLAAAVGACSAFTYDSRGLSALFCADFGLVALDLETKSADGTYTQYKEVGLGTADVNLAASYALGDLFHLSMRLGGQFQVGELSAQRPDGTDLFKGGLFSGYALGGLGLHF